MSRVLIVSNRLPVTVRPVADGLEVESSSGGLATGMRGPHARTGGLWFGWSGVTTPLSPEQDAELKRRFADLRLVPVPISADEVERYYEGFSNGVLWPLFHGFVGLMPLEIAGFETTLEVSERFADVVASHYQDGDVIWVHDYQLMLLPRLLRERLPRARIGFFLHIPFPPASAFRTLPHREALLEGALGADLIGLHTAEYARHFSSSVLRVLGRPSEVGGITWQGRQVEVGVFPMGIDAAHFGELARDPAVHALRDQFRGESPARLLVGIDRLDYTKGIPRRLLAYERLLQDAPELLGKVRLVQVAVPSRINVDTYQDFRSQVDGLIGRIQGRFATPSWAPIHYLFRGLSEKEVAALYLAADVLLVTPIRDGMNLVAKEFVATREDEAGVLVLSEFAGAASELAEALHVNPYDVAGTAGAIRRALELEPEQRRARMAGLRKRVLAFDVHHWAESFLKHVVSAEREVSVPATSSRADVGRMIERLTRADDLALLLDYDGTLVSIAETPELASPDEALLALLRRLAARRRTEVHVVSGRRKVWLDEWLGSLPIGLHAEHGLWSRVSGSAEWVTHPVEGGAWRDATRKMLADWAERTPGSLTEEKTAGFAWHYRMADPEFGLSQANELRVHLTEVLSNAPVEVLHGNRVIEVRPQGVNKGRVATAVATQRPTRQVVAIGDDRTDEDMFAALPPTGLRIAVGPIPMKAQLRLSNAGAVRALLRALADAP